MLSASRISVSLLAALTLPAVQSGTGHVAVGAGFVRVGVVAPDAKCGAAKDSVVLALEMIQATTSTEQLTRANELLKRAADLCSDDGEAFYYRYLVETKLGHVPQARYALEKASRYPSEAFMERINPFILSTPGSKPAEPLPTIRQRWALVVGIGDFADKSIAKLAYTSDDATSFRDVLVDPKLGGFKPENVRLLTNAGAKLSDIKKGVNWLARNAGADDLVVVYVASHGSPRSSDTAGANYIIAHDTELGEAVDPDSLYASAYPMVELANAIATRLKSLRTAVFLDTCYSGGVVAGNNKAPGAGLANASVSSATLEHIRQGTGRIIFAASRTEEQSLESERLKHGYFTYYLVQALREHPGMPLSGIFKLVEQRVSAEVDADYKLYGLHQVPVLSRSADDTDFALGVEGDGRVTAGVDAGGSR